MQQTLSQLKHSHAQDLKRVEEKYIVQIKKLEEEQERGYGISTLASSKNDKRERLNTLDDLMNDEEEEQLG